MSCYCCTKYIFHCCDGFFTSVILFDKDSFDSSLPRIENKDFYKIPMISPFPLLQNREQRSVKKVEKQNKTKQQQKQISKAQSEYYISKPYDKIPTMMLQKSTSSFIMLLSISFTLTLVLASISTFVAGGTITGKVVSCPGELVSSFFFHLFSL
jgi:hypothetical protein